MRSPFQEIANRVNVSSSGLDRSIPRTFVVDLAINPVTGKAEVVQSYPIVTEVDSNIQENMKQLLDMILAFFEDEERKVDSGELKEEDQLFPDVQTIDPSTQHHTRSLPPGFIRRRA